MSVRILATGLTGTIGRHFGPSVGDLRIRLEGPIPTFGSSLDNCAVIHSAAAVGEALVRRDLQHSYSINVSGAVKLARAVLQSRAERFIFVSTSHVYERQSEAIFLSESDSVLPQAQYALQKLIAEELITEEFRAEPSRLIIARVFSVVHQTQPPGTLGSTIMSLLRDPKLKLNFADDERDFLSPKVIAGILVSLAQSATAPRTVNICSGTATTVRETARLLLGDDLFKQIQERVVGGQSKNPRIVGNPDVLTRTIQQTGPELFAASVADWKLSRPNR